MFSLFFFFFFQAEDGIRDVAVTGVQTCALPIWIWEGGNCGGWSGRIHPGATTYRSSRPGTVDLADSGKEELGYDRHPRYGAARGSLDDHVIESRSDVVARIGAARPGERVLAGRERLVGEKTDSVAGEV